MRFSAFLLTSLLVAGRAAALPQDLNQITKIDVQESAGAVVITIAGSRPPSFTTFPLEDPPRFVVDFNDATLVKVPDDIPVGDGTVNIIRTVNYPGESTSIARVMIAFLRPVDPPDLQAVGNAVVVKVAKPAAPRAEIAAAAPAPAAEHAAPEKVEAAPAVAAAPVALGAAAEATIAAGARAAEEKAAAAAREEALAKERAEADAKAVAE
ncbi:MAG: AMIN domain-containing protein, partial [Anaeromyxobacteraceae bacterium]